ncbi:MAG: formyl transferase [Bacteroidaceae bacterium]|nr:formyl transferase [Bacteroidaceae bacterium]
MIIKILGNKDTAAYIAAKTIILAHNHELWSEGHNCCHLAIAPLLTEKVPDDELREPLLGTLIFHPSPLPYGRGASSIKWAYKRQEPITAATWFWADSGYDTGDICEQEIVKIDYRLRPRDFYETHILTAMERTLERALNGIERGLPRRIPQVEQYSSFDKRL